MAVNLLPPNPADLHPVPGVRIGVTEAGIRKAGRKDLTVVLLDDLKRLGYHHATRAGLSISISDMHIPGIKKETVSVARQKVKAIEGQAKAGVITNEALVPPKPNEFDRTARI